MSKGGEKTVTQTTGLDPGSQTYIDRMRAAATSGADAIGNAGPLFLGPDSRSIDEQIAPFLNPYMSHVVDATRGEYDRLRGGARRSVTDAAIQNRAYGGSRHGVAEGVRLGELDRAETGQLASLFSSGFSDAVTRGLQYSEYQRSLRERQAQDPIFRNQARHGLMNRGLGPTGQTNTTTEKTKSDPWGQLLGLGLTGLSIWNPFAGAAAGAVKGSMDNWGGGTVA